MGNLSIAAPLFGLPVRLSANAVVENDRFISSRGADLDKIGGSLRFQYVDPNNDQGFSPYVAYAPRFDFLPTFLEKVATRQDVNLGFNKRFNLDGNFQSIPFAGNTAALTVWSFGLTIFGQRRFRDPTPSSSALFFVPSVSYVISEQWNASLAVEIIGRWFDSNDVGFSRRDWEAQTHRDARICHSNCPVWCSRNSGFFRPACIGFPDIFRQKLVEPAAQKLSSMDGERRHQDGLALLIAIAAMGDGILPCRPVSRHGEKMV